MVRPTTTDEASRRPRTRAGASAAGLGAGARPRPRLCLAIIAEADGLSLTSIAQRAGIAAVDRAPHPGHAEGRRLRPVRRCPRRLPDRRQGLQDRQRLPAQPQAGRCRPRRHARPDGGKRRNHQHRRSRTTATWCSSRRSKAIIRSAPSTGPARAGRCMPRASARRCWRRCRTKAVTQMLHRVGMPKFTEHTIVDPEALLADLALVRKRGWAIDDRGAAPTACAASVRRVSTSTAK